MLRLQFWVALIHAGGIPAQTHPQDGQVWILSGNDWKTPLYTLRNQENNLRVKPFSPAGGRFPELHSLRRSPFLFHSRSPTLKMSYVTNDDDKIVKNVLQHSSKFHPHRPASDILPHQPESDDRHLFQSIKNPSSLSFSTHLVAGSVANTTSTQWKSVPCLCFHSNLAPCSQSLCLNCRKSTFRLTPWWIRYHVQHEGFLTGSTWYSVSLLSFCFCCLFYMCWLELPTVTQVPLFFPARNADLKPSATSRTLVTIRSFTTRYSLLLKQRKPL